MNRQRKALLACSTKITSRTWSYTFKTEDNHAGMPDIGHKTREGMGDLITKIERDIREKHRTLKQLQLQYHIILAGVTWADHCSNYVSFRILWGMGCFTVLVSVSSARMSTSIFVPCRMESLNILMKAPKLYDNILSSWVKAQMLNSMASNLTEFPAEASDVAHCASFIAFACMLSTLASMVFIHHISLWVLTNCVALVDAVPGFKI